MNYLHAQNFGLGVIGAGAEMAKAWARIYVEVLL